MQEELSRLRRQRAVYGTLVWGVPGIVGLGIGGGVAYTIKRSTTVGRLKSETYEPFSRSAAPDWDITTPELKAAWERDAHNRFYPYGKTCGQVFREQD